MFEMLENILSGQRRAEQQKEQRKRKTSATDTLQRLTGDEEGMETEDSDEAIQLVTQQCTTEEEGVAEATRPSAQNE